MEDVRGVNDRIDGRVGAQQRDAPPLLAQREREADQRQVVQLARRAGQDGARAAAIVPAAATPDEPGAQHPAGEVLLGDGDLAGAPSLAEVAQIREHDARDHRLEGEVLHDVVDRRVCAALVEALQRGTQLGDRIAVELGGPGRGVLRACTGSGLGGRQPARKVLLHRDDPGDVGIGIQPEATGAASRIHELVAAFPCAQHVGGEADPSREFADAQVSLCTRGRQVVGAIVGLGQTLRLRVQVLSMEL